jgi:molybdenum cofactor synthesis domain-containing protein
MLCPIANKRLNNKILLMTSTAAVLIIGNEILSGRTQDINLQYLAKRLGELGIRLNEARIIPDEMNDIVNSIQALSIAHTYVFTTGGIGFTHDDITAKSIAKAFGVEIEEHPEALRLLQEYYGDALNEARRRMALIPVGATLIANPVSKAPGFQIGNVFVLAGVPSVMQAMFESLVGKLTGGKPIKYATVSCQLAEGIIADELTLLQDRHPEVDVGSYPYFKNGILGTSLVVRGVDSDSVASAVKDIADMVMSLGGVPAIES